MLTYNDVGGAVVRQSDLASWARCQLQKKYTDEARDNAANPQPKALSATVFGTVVHYALLVLEKAHQDKRDDALDTAIATFEHFWDPRNIDAVATPVTHWLPRQTYGGLRERGRNTLRGYYQLLEKDDGKLLALEYQFEVPIEADGRQHTLTGTLDRLAVRKWYGTPYLAIEDFKTGKQPTYLRYNMQGTAYAYATTRPEFWSSNKYPSFDETTVKGIEKHFAKHRYQLHEGTQSTWWNGPATTEMEGLAGRRFRWVNMQDLRFADGGWRTDVDYERLRITIDAYVRANEAGIYSPTLTGEICRYCDFQHSCTDVGLPSHNDGEPRRRWGTK